MKQAVEGEKRWWVSIVSLDSDTKDSPGVFIIILIVIILLIIVLLLLIIITIIVLLLLLLYIYSILYLFRHPTFHPFQPIDLRLFRCQFSQQFG